MSLSLRDFAKEPLPNIALFGKLRSGKDEVHKVLKGLGFNVERVAFGDIMKEKFSDIFPLIPMEPKPVKELQKFNLLTDIDEGVWVRPTMARMKVRADILAQAGLTPPAFVITDLRQPHEYEACKKAGFVMVRVHAPEEIRVKRALENGEVITKEILEAPTEKYIDSFEYDHVIINDGEYNELVKEVIELVYQLQTKRNDV